MNISSNSLKSRCKNKILNFCENKKIKVDWIGYNFDLYNPDDSLPLNHFFTVCLEDDKIYETELTHSTIEDAIDEMLFEIKEDSNL